MQHQTDASLFGGGVSEELAYPEHLYQLEACSFIMQVWIILWTTALRSFRTLVRKAAELFELIGCHDG
jgi:hypothetical protein